MDRIVEQQLARIGRGAVDAVGRVLHAAVATEAGADQVLTAGQAELRRSGQGFLEQQWHVERNDLCVDQAQLADQLLVEEAAQLRSRALHRGAIHRRGQAQVGQQPDHDVLRAALLQGLGAGGQAIGGGCGAGRAGDLPLEEVVAAAGQVVKRVGIGAQSAGQIPRAFAQHGAGPGIAWWNDHVGSAGDRVENLVGAVAAHCPVVAVRTTECGIDR
ncbi:hypothetical protein D9M71_364760 [compost metagenome]